MTVGDTAYLLGRLNRLIYPHNIILGFLAVLIGVATLVAPVAARPSDLSPLPLLDPANQSPNDLLARGGGGIAVDDSALYVEGQAVIGNLERPLTDHISLYVVRSGDSLSEIAKMFDVSVNTILWANDLKRGTAIHEGQVLAILPITGLKHVVAKGETLEALAKKYKGDVAEIIVFNNLDSESPLVPGLEIIIPDGEEAGPIASPGKVAQVKGAGGPDYAGYYRRPIDGGRKSQGLHGYNGVDLAATVGTPIMAAAAGTVVISRQGGWNGGYGNYVVIRHENNTQTLYAHTARNIVAVGESVVQGQVIGYIGLTGKTTGPHLHFEVRGAKNPF